MEGKRERMAGWKRSDATYSKTLAFGRNFSPASWWKDQKKESRQNRSQVSASFHRRTEHGGKEEEWMDGSDASFSKSLAFGRNLTPASWWKDQKTELFPSFNSASFHIKTEPGGKEEGWMEVTPAGRISAAPVSWSRFPQPASTPSENALPNTKYKWKLFWLAPIRLDVPFKYYYSTISIIPMIIQDFAVTKADIITT